MEGVPGPFLIALENPYTIWVDDKIQNHDTEKWQRFHHFHPFKRWLFRVLLAHEPRKKPSYFPLYWLVNRDPYHGLLNPYITG